MKKPTNRIKHLMAPFPAPLTPVRSEKADESKDEEVPDVLGETEATSEDEDEDEDEDGITGSGDGDDEDDGDDDDDDDDDEGSPENYLRSKVFLAMEENAALTCGKAVVHEDPQDADKLLVVMQLDKFIEDEEMPNLEGAEMRDVAVILVFEGKGHTGPKRRIVALDKLSQIFDPKNWKKNNNK